MLFTAVCSGALAAGGWDGSLELLKPPLPAPMAGHRWERRAGRAGWIRAPYSVPLRAGGAKRRAGSAGRIGTILRFYSKEKKKIGKKQDWEKKD